SGSFLDDLTDTLKLTAGIFPDILPLININDYERPMMNLMGTLIDSSLISARDYESYQSKFLLEAKQELKKQVIKEKNRSIEKAQEDDEEELTGIYRNNYDNTDRGNYQLDLYATLLMPFWDKNPAVPQLVNQLLSGSDNRLKYNTAILLLRHKKQVPDTLLSYFAGLDEYRYELYSDLKKNGLISKFPAAHNNHIQLAKSQLLSQRSYDKPDTVAYVDRLPVKQKDRAGFVYFFKYKQGKDDNAWKLATVGIVPSDAKSFLFDGDTDYWQRQQYDFTDLNLGRLEADEPVADQIKKALKKMQYSKRNSAAEFYEDEDRAGGYNLLSRLSLRE
ncbi:MAG TPA: hypothetical protein VFR58_09220, partial [Flavisolibacter sp.]|nr:hypothetical protein [Flavisolibacter sp.]